MGVRTYIQSGNLVFGTGTSCSSLDHAGVAALIGRVLRDEFGVEVPVVVRTVEELAGIVHPADDATIDPKFLHVFFLDRPVPQDSAVTIPADRFLPDTFVIGRQEIYVAYPNGSGRSKLTGAVFERAFGVVATARNLNTVRALVELGSDHGDADAQ